MKYTISAKNKKQFDYGMKHSEPETVLSCLRGMAKDTNADHVTFTAGYPNNQHMKFSFDRNKK